MYVSTSRIIEIIISIPNISSPCGFFWARHHVLRQRFNTNRGLEAMKRTAVERLVGFSQPSIVHHVSEGNSLGTSFFPVLDMFLISVSLLLRFSAFPCLCLYATLLLSAFCFSASLRLCLFAFLLLRFSAVCCFLLLRLK